jgi:hypothetical protein
MVSIDMSVSKLDDELFGLGASDMRDHVGKESIGSDVEWDSEAQVRGTLVHETREAGFSCGIGFGGELDVELAHHMARRECHLGYIYDDKQGRKARQLK